MSGRAEGEELKRLGFLKSYLSKAVAYGEGFYSKARGFTPAFAEPYVLQLEDKSKAIAAPAVTKGQDAAADVLAKVDGQLDYLVNTLNATLDYSRELHSKNMQSFNAARSSYFGFVAGLVDATKARLDPQRYVAYATELGKTLVDTVAAYADPDKAVATLTAALDRVLSFGPVPKVVELADPLVTVGQNQYTKAHDVLVAQPLYKRFYDITTSLPGALQESPLFGRVYPLVAPVADPVVANFSNSKVLRQLDDHLKPKTA